MDFALIASRRHDASPSAELSRIVTQVLQASLADLGPMATRRRDEAVRRACRSALQRLWDRRDGLARALRAVPTADAVEDFRIWPRMGGGQDEQERNMVQLNSATSLAALVLRSGAQSLAPANAPVRTDARWPFSPRHWAMALRRVVELASPEHAVRIELMRIGTRLLCPHFVDVWRRTTVAASPRQRSGDAQGSAEPTPKTSQMQRHGVKPEVDEAVGRPTGSPAFGHRVAPAPSGRA
jgi:hypothetical protein